MFFAEKLAALLVAGLVVAACSPADSTAPSDPAPLTSTSSLSPSGSPTDPAAGSSTTPAPDSASSSPASPTETVFASLCDKATREQREIVQGAMKPDFTVTQLVDVRTDDSGKHALLGFVQGPGLAVLAQWTGTGLALEGLGSADEFSAQASTAPLVTPDEELERLLGATVQCYTAVFAPKS